jgi:hypothetical protein
LGGDENRRVVERYVDAIAANDWDALGQLQRPEFVEEWPQSGEGIRGRDNYRVTLENYPGGVLKGGVSERSIVGSADQWVMSPSFTLHRIEGSGDTYTFEGKASYPGGDEWHVVSIPHIAGGQVAHSTAYFAPPFEPPEWRSQWVERM